MHVSKDIEEHMLCGKKLARADVITAACPNPDRTPVYARQRANMLIRPPRHLSELSKGNIMLLKESAACSKAQMRVKC